MSVVPANEPLLKFTTLSETRTKVRDAGFAVVFILANLIAFGFQIAFIVRGSAFLNWYSCLEEYPVEIPLAVVSDGVAGVLKGGGGAILGASVALCFFFSIFWIYSIRVCARAIVWLTYIIGWTGVLVLLVVMKQKYAIGTTDPEFIVFCAILAISAIVIFARRDSIERAARVLSTSCEALGESPYLFVFTFLFQLLQLCYFGFYMYSALNSYFSYNVLSSPPARAYGNEQCGYVDRDLVEQSLMYLSPPRDWVYIGAYFSAFIFLWNVFFGDGLRLFITTGVMAEWYFTTDRKRKNSRVTVFRYWKWAITVQLGTLAVSSLVSAAIQKLKNWAKINGCGCCCPHVWLARILMCFLQSCVRLITRFNLAYAALSGDGFAQALRSSFDILTKNFGDAVTNEFTAAIVINFGTLFFSLGVGLIVWATSAYQLGRPVFTFMDIITCDAGNTDPCTYVNTAVHFIMFGFSGWVAYNTLLGLFLLIMFPSLWTLTLGQCVYMGVLAMLIARLIFTFVGGLMQDAVTGMFMCAAIDKQNGTTSPKRHFIDTVMKEEKCPVAWYTVVAVQPPVTIYTPAYQVTPGQPQFHQGAPPPQFYQQPVWQPSPHHQQPPPQQQQSPYAPHPYQQQPPQQQSPHHYQQQQQSPQHYPPQQQHYAPPQQQQSPHYQQQAYAGQQNANPFHQAYHQNGGFQQNMQPYPPNFQPPSAPPAYDSALEFCGQCHTPLDAGGVCVKCTAGAPKS